MTPPTKLEDLLSPAQISERDGKPILSPNKTEEISAIARYANDHRLAIEITGAGTKRSWGNPVTADLLLSTTRLAGVRQHSWQDLTATVGAGTRWADMQHTLAEHNQFVALDPLWPETATVGGILSTNDSGPIRLKYGSLRDLVIGMTIVLADGTIARSGGKVVKNVAGYDLHKLMIGAFGTLGIITEINFRLHPIPQHTQTFTVSAPQASQLAPLMQTIRGSHLQTEGLQLRGDSSGFHLDIQLSAHPHARQSDILESFVDDSRKCLSRSLDIHRNVAASEIGLGFSPGIDAANKSGFSPRDMPSAQWPQNSNGKLQPSTVEDIHSARESLFQPDATVIKLAVPASELCEYLDHMQWAPDIEVACVAQSSGLIFAALEGSPAALEAYIQSIKADLTVLTTSTNVNHWKADPNALPLMREIKRQFDPNRILNPGRFLGGI